MRKASTKETRSEVITLKVTPSQKNAIKAMAQNDGLTLSSWAAREILNLNLDIIPKIVYARGPRPLHPDLKAAINRIGNNMNQLAKSKHMSNIDHVEILSGLTVIERQLKLLGGLWR